MRKNIFVSIIAIFFAIICLQGCKQEKEIQLPVPSNLNIWVTGRLMTVTWDAVKNASGYIIYTASEGCGSGNRIVNTVTKTAANHAGTETSSSINETGLTSSNGFVTFTGDTSFTIWLMAGTPDTTPMATSLTAKIMSIGDGEKYLDSEYSEIAVIAKADYR